MQSWNFPLLPADEYNRELLGNVHPANWQNPEPETLYNLVVIGAGTAGLISAIGTASLGGKVALVERHLMGGDCLNVGCVPSKALIRPARLAAEMKTAADLGLSPAAAGSEDFPKIMERLRRLRARISKNDSAQRYDELGVDVFLGEGRFTSPSTVVVEGHTLTFKRAVVCTGARALLPDIPGLEKADPLTNESVFNLTELPEHLIVIGSGPIGCEMAQAFRRFGSKVTILQRSIFLRKEDQEAARVLKEVFEEEGIKILEHCTFDEVQTKGAEKHVLIRHDGVEKRVIGTHLLVGTGRAPNVESLGLETAGVEFDAQHGVSVNDFLQTTHPNIYAAGDCCMQWKFTHAADAAAQIVIQNALFKGRKKLSQLTMPWCTYTDPEIAHTGLYAQEAEAQQLEYDTFKFDLAESDRAIVDGEDRGFVKVIVKKGSDQILGATIVAAHAGEMISELTSAIVNKIGLGKLGNVIHPYPTQAEAIKRVAGLYNKTRLTPFVAGMLKKWLTWQRR